MHPPDASGEGIWRADTTSRFFAVGPACSGSGGVSRFTLATRRSQVVQLPFAHRFDHRLRRPPQLAFLPLAAFRGQGGAGCLLLGFGFRWHAQSLHSAFPAVVTWPGLKKRAAAGGFQHLVGFCRFELHPDAALRVAQDGSNGAEGESRRRRPFTCVCVDKAGRSEINSSTGAALPPGTGGGKAGFRVRNSTLVLRWHRIADARPGGRRSAMALYQVSLGYKTERNRGKLSTATPPTGRGVGDGANSGSADRRHRCLRRGR